jgi:hypothetical protein
MPKAIFSLMVEYLSSLTRRLAVSTLSIGDFDTVIEKKEKNMFTCDRKDTALGLMLGGIASKIGDKPFLQFSRLSATDS